MQKPGPDKYIVKPNTFDSRAIVIGKEKRNGLGNDTNNPGPGSYEPKMMNSSLPLFSIPKSSLGWIQSSKNPGPGTYEPKPVYHAESSVGMNKDNRKPFYD